MITGRVTESLEAQIPVRLRGPLATDLAVDAIIDTGFDGMLTLPPAVIQRLGLSLRQRARVILGDGSEAAVDVFEVLIEWDGAWRNVAVASADIDSLVGMALLRGHDGTMRVTEGGAVSITKI